MEKEDISLLVQLLTAMKDLASRLEECSKRKDITEFNAARKEFLELQRKVGELL